MKINLKLNKKIVFLVVVLAWGIFSVWYIANDQWQDFKEKELKESYQAGINEAVKTVVTEVSKCQQLPLSSGEETANIISVECLQKQQTQQPQVQPQPSVQSSIEQNL